MPAVVEPLVPETELPVDPGKEAVARFSVRNTGDDVDNFTFRVIGEPARWTKTGIRVVGGADGERLAGEAAPELDLLPDARGEVEVFFRPPDEDHTVPAPGLVPYGLLVSAYELDERQQRVQTVAALEEGLLNVGRFHKRSAALLPRTSRGRRSGTHRLAVDNYGNTTATATLAAEDAENLLEVTFSPRVLVIPPDQVGFTKVKVRPRRKFLLGPPRAAPFKVHVTFAADPGDTPAVTAAGQIPPVDGLHMQRSIIPVVMLPIAALVAAGVILWAIFKPRVEPLAPQVTQAQQAAAAQQVAVNGNTIARRANRLTARAINTAHHDAAAAQKQAKDAAQQAQENAQKTQQQATKATNAATNAGAQASKATSTANKALQAATPPFGGTPFAQPLALPPGCSSSCATPQPLTAQPFPAQTFYVSDVVVGNPGTGKGTLTLTLGGKPVLVEPIASGSTADFKPVTPLLVQGDKSLAARVSCSQGPCTPSVFVSGFAPAKAPVASGPNGTPSSTRLTRSTATFNVPAKAASYSLTDVVFQNPAGDTGTVTLARGGQPLFAQGLVASEPGDVPISLTAPVVLKAGEKLTLKVSCKNPGGKACTPGALLVGVLKLS
jgi:hypothetical protein